MNNATSQRPQFDGSSSPEFIVRNAWDITDTTK
jgi:hypothetical protein